MSKKYYILMADVIGSGNKNGHDLMIDFKEIVDHINKENKKTLLSPLTITLGDEFQGIPCSLESSIDLILKIEEQIVLFQKDLKLRYVLHHGPIDTPINPKIAYEMLGGGLTHARQLLESLKSERKDRFHIDLKENPSLGELLDLAFVGYQSIVDNWRFKDLEVVSDFITYKGDYKKVAEKSEKDNSSVFRRRDSLQIRAYFSSKKLLSKLPLQLHKIKETIRTSKYKEKDFLE